MNGLTLAAHLLKLAYQGVALYALIAIAWACVAVVREVRK